jgi:tRNA threonylcarbamoyladenosine biosynthesis protein TsaB
MPRPPDPAVPLRLLAFDTSTERLAAGLSAGGATYTVLAAGGALASATLLPHLLALLERARLTWADLDAVAFGRGPGAFTGLRTACAVAQGLGLGLERPLLPLDSLLVVAEDARAQAGPAAAPLDVGVAMDARMGEVYAARYRWLGGWSGGWPGGEAGGEAGGGPFGTWQVLEAPRLTTPAALAQAWAGVALDALAGSALAFFGPRQLPPGARRFEHELDRAAALLRLALLAAQAGEGVDPALALPLYLRDKVAQTTQERERARAAGGAPAPR